MVEYLGKSIVLIQINDKMVEECHAVGYHGQSKEEIAEEHLLNRKNVVI